MSEQISANMIPKPKSREPETLKEEGKWMDAPELVSRVEAVRVKAIEKIQGYLEGTVPRLVAAVYCHDALLATMCFGYMPPLRDYSILLSLTRPSHRGCVHEDCQHRATGCLGNRVYKHPTTGESSGIFVLFIFIR